MMTFITHFSLDRYLCIYMFMKIKYRTRRAQDIMETENKSIAEYKTFPILSKRRPDKHEGGHSARMGDEENFPSSSSFAV